MNALVPLHHIINNIVLIPQREVDAVWTWEEDRKCLKTVHIDKYDVETVIERLMDDAKDIQVKTRNYFKNNER